MNTVVCEGVHCRVVIERPAQDVVVMRIEGWDAGELGDAPMRELAKDVEKGKPLELFIDARAVKGATLEVSGEWAQWLAKHRSAFKRINMLTGTRFIQLTANFVRRFAELGEIMRISTDPVAFDAELAQSVGRA
jgi:hypothetical protein